MKFKEPLSESIWKSKYCCIEVDHCDSSIEETWQRIASAISKAETQQQDEWQVKFYKLLEDFKFLPGGRIIAGAGAHRDVTLMNCFVMGTIADSIDGIFDSLKEGAKTMQLGGGVGYDFSTLRPRGLQAEGVGNVASGPVSFMEVWDSMCKTMLSTSSRRGAMMATLSCDHPDIEKFILAKSAQNQLTNFNVSVLITNEFMKCLKSDGEWPLKFNQREVKKVKARLLWEKIVQQSFQTSEPGVLFVDQINEDNNLYYCEDIQATNPCGEVPLPPYGACNLGSFNLTAFVVDAFESSAHFNFSKFEELVPLAGRFLDNVLDVTQFPLSKQKEQALSSRRIGVGVTGLASALAMLNMKYGGEESLVFIDKLMKTLSEGLYLSSCELAVEKSPFPQFDVNKFAQQGFARRLPSKVRNKISKSGLRNSHLLAIAPTGTISLLANNISSGIEPIFDYAYRRKVKLENELIQEFTVKEYACQLWEEKKPGEELPDSFVKATDVDPQEQLKIMAVVQRHVDQAISKTLFIPETANFLGFKSVFESAFKLGLKGCTVYRPSSVRGSVLSSK